jgi:uncharacterized protein (DUF2235 family)
VASGLGIGRCRAAFAEADLKRLVFCFDGTWNALSADTPTNVVLTAASIIRHTSEDVTQIIHYDEGVGTGRLEKWSGGIIGSGLIENVREAYRFLIFNYDPGDQIFVSASLGVPLALRPSSAFCVMSDLFTGCMPRGSTMRLTSTVKG